MVIAGKVQRGSSPGDHALGSPLSRAAARAMSVNQFVGRDTLTIVMGNNIPGMNIIEPNITPWRERVDGRLYRRAYLPVGMTLSEAERIVAQPGWTPSILTEAQEPRPPLVPEW